MDLRVQISAKYKFGARIRAQKWRSAGAWSVHAPAAGPHSMSTTQVSRLVTS
jgi:hypothetical protein